MLATSVPGVPAWPAFHSESGCTETQRISSFTFWMLWLHFLSSSYMSEKLRWQQAFTNVFYLYV